ncbi:MAG: hypothetical protein IJW00_05405 [Clostridia bacterium]|nr:hypothetical protein [Clostridia bacterium]
MLNTKLFNIRLYLEGLKRLKVIGMAVAILSMTISALIPIVQWMDTPLSKETVDLIEQNQLCFPLYVVIFLAPFFFLVLFSFLHKRKESDFFHAIPYTRTCVYLSFAAAALTFVFLIMAASAATAGIIWALNPFTTFRFWELITLTLMCMLAAAEISAIMMLALSLTGTPTTTMLMFALFTLFTRLIMFYLSSCIDTNMDIIYPQDLPYLGFDWFLPFGMFSYALNGSRYIDFNPFESPANIIYSLVVTVVLFVVAWFFYKIRKSEMAGNTAPNRMAQHIFRILFTLPFILLIPMAQIMEEGKTEITLLLVLAVVTLLVYYLYELITTKRFKGFGKATLLLPVPVICCFLFVGAYHAVEWTVFSMTPDEPSDVISVSIDETNAQWDDYQQYLLQDSASYDEEVIGIMVSNAVETVECDRLDDYSSFLKRQGKYDPYAGKYSVEWMTVDFKLKNGMTVTRRVAFTDSEYSEVRYKYINTIHIDEDLFWSLPEVEELTHVHAEYLEDDMYVESVTFDLDAQLKAFYKVLIKEYNTLSAEEKEKLRGTYYYEYEGNDKGQNRYYSFGINGRISGTNEKFYINLIVPEDLLPETFNYLQNID